MTTTYKDPVCGRFVMALDPAKTRLSSDFEGATYYFCSQGCKQAFDGDPAQYTRTPSAADAAHAGHAGSGATAGQATTRPHAMSHSVGERSTDQPVFFGRDVAGLQDAVQPAAVELQDGATLEMVAAPVRKRIGDADVRMLAYNGSIPGPVLSVRQDSEVTVRFGNEMDLDTTVHWHGLRHDNFFDGVPAGPHAGVQAPVPPGGVFTYKLRFPDPGIYWYHPHVREDYAQEHGLYGSIVVTPSDPAYWAPANREFSLMVDDILIEDGQVAPFSKTMSDHTAMGRFGNVMLVNGETDFGITVDAGDVVRFFVTNTANTRFFSFAIPGTQMKLVGGDNGRLEREEFIKDVLLSPSERAVVDVLFERAGSFTIEHRTPDQSYRLGVVNVTERRAAPSYASEFRDTRVCEDLVGKRRMLDEHLQREPDKTIALVGVMPAMAHHSNHGGSQAADTGIEWEDTMEAMNRTSTPETMLWKIIDRETAAENEAISWVFQQDDRVKIRIVNEPGSDHPMPHPFHIHGERFLVLSRNAEVNPNLVWKDTVLVNAGETLDLLMEASNPGVWMAHCHIAEHLEGGMMFSFEVMRR
jgi:FtsP/CotA-like multicopper oxidase with cupredoxin domain/YHS domain-containing protein